MSGHAAHAQPLPDAHTMHGWVAWHARRLPGAPALIARGARVTYGQLHERIMVLAGALAARGVTSGDRVLIALPNHPATVVAALAANTLGAIAVEASRTWPAAMLGEVLRMSGARHVVIWERDRAQWTGMLAGVPVDQAWLVGGGTGPGGDHIAGVPVSRMTTDGTLVTDPDADPVSHAREMPDDAAALVLYTSGSTGRPLGVIQTVGNIHANTRSIVEYLELTASDRAFLTLPLAYCYGRSVLQTHLYVGASVYLENGMAFPRVAMETLTAEDCTGFAGVPLTFEILRRQVDLRSMALGSLRYMTQAGGSMAPATAAWLRDAIKPAELYIMYGQTEATARLTYLPPDRASTKSGSIGIPVPGVEVRVVDESGRAVPAGTVGEVEARGDNVTPGYWNDPEATARIIRDGWLRTGDLGYLDADGYLYHRGRVKEILKVGGHRISPVEIEQVLEGHPDIQEAAVRGVADDLMGELPVAFVVYRPGRRPDEASLQEFVRRSLPQWMVPARVIPLDHLPRNEAGKLLRTELIEPD